MKCKTILYNSSHTWVQWPLCINYPLKTLSLPIFPLIWTLLSHLLITDAHSQPLVPTQLAPVNSSDPTLLILSAFSLLYLVLALYNNLIPLILFSSGLNVLHKYLWIFSPPLKYYILSQKSESCLGKKWLLNGSMMSPLANTRIYTSIDF